MELETDRLILRYLSLEDVSDFFAYRSDREANKYQGWIPNTLHDARDFIKFKIHSIPNVPDTWIQLAVINKADNTLIGDIGVYFMPENKNEVKLGYTLASSYQGFGYASEAIEALIDHLCHKFNKTHFIALISPENYASIRLVERLGFIQKDIALEPNDIENEYPDDLLFILEK
jgi:RimJ/RimL family protein N-acetyltransferase